MTPEEFRDAFHGLGISHAKAIFKEFSVDVDFGKPMYALSKATFLEEMRLMWNPSNQPLSLCHMMMTATLGAAASVQVYNLPNFPTLRAARLCRIHALKFGELLRRTYVAALTSQEKNTQLRNVFEATRRAFVTYAPLRRIMAAGGDTSKFETLVGNISLLLPEDVILLDVPEPSLSTRGFVRNFFRAVSFEFDVSTAMRRRGVPMMRDDLRGDRRDEMRFANETALYVPAPAFILLSANTTGPMLADAPVIASRLAALMWNQVVYENTWSPQTRKAIGLQR
ncbi:hypothetical protein V5799_003243 [Amblyomma americanum]|uniref:Uncharacterized protein n=1 Tax=Amblyomma americanum TaxID=6943 RepID=A0AAQ4D9H8_AMBAM